MALSDVTDLVITGVTIPECAARGMVEEIGLIAQAAQVKRTVNGTLVDLSDPNFRKRKWRISGSDMSFPDFSSAWPGMSVSVTTTSTIGSGHLSISGRLLDWTATYNEWDAATTWTMDVEEI